MAIYLKKFENHTAYEAAESSLILPNVSLCVSEGDVYYNPAPDPYNGHDYVDLGLPSGTKWATMNVGANSVTDYGNYYQYGKGATTYQNNRSGAELIYCIIGTINITNGTFRNDGEDKKFTLNCLDDNYRAGTAKIIVSGGKFYDFDPANSMSEPGGPVSFLAEGYHTEASTVIEEGVEHTVYTVKKDS